MSQVNYKEILWLKCQNYSNAEISRITGSARKTIKDVLERAGSRIDEIVSNRGLDNDQIYAMLYPERLEQEVQYCMPDFEMIHRELAHKGVNLALLCSEYQARCRSQGLKPYMYSEFCDKYRRWNMKSKATMRIHHKPGDSMEVDWAGRTVPITDPQTGFTSEAYLFAAVLPCSCYAYVELTRDMQMENWIMCHVHAYSYFNGVPRLLIPDNLKTGVTENTRYATKIPRTYVEMSDHYHTAIVPTRVRAPQDKPHAEGTVRYATTWILAAIRNEVFYSFEEARNRVAEKLEELNRREFEKRNGCRKDAYELEEKAFMQPLPYEPYELSIWTQAKVLRDYNVTDGTNNYSVPYTLIGETVDIRTTRDTVEIFFHGKRVASHVRLHKKEKDPVMQTDHMPENHRKYLNYGKEDFLSWAGGIGEYTLRTARYFLESGKEPEQGFKYCASLTKLADRYGSRKIEQACRDCYECSGIPSVRSISMFLKSPASSHTGHEMQQSQLRSVSRGFTRGPEQFSKGDDKS